MARSRHSFARHTHEQFGIGIIEQGGQIWHSGRGQVEAGPGDVITVNPGEVHDGAPVTEEGRAWRMLYLDPVFVADRVLDITDDGASGFELQQPVLHDARKARLVSTLIDAATSLGETLRLEELLLAVLAAVGSLRTLYPAAQVRPEIQRARRRIDDDPSAPVTLGDLAALGGLNRFQLLRGFKTVTGMTPHAYLLQRRIQLARRLISGGATLAAAAAASGFADQSHMTRAFVSRYGVTPGGYLNAVR